MSKQTSYKQLQQMLPILTEIPFVIADITFQNGSIDLIGAVAIPHLDGQGRSTPLTPIRLSLTATEPGSWRIVDIAVQSDEATEPSPAGVLD